MRIVAADKAIASSLSRRVAPSPEEIEELVQALLANMADHSPRSLDGVLIFRDTYEARSYVGQGTAITVADQHGHPLEWYLLLSEDHALAAGSYVRFGHINGHAYGSAPYNRLIATAFVQFPSSLQWRHRFERIDQCWTASAA